jgi:Holliday junction resolvasome RuvABC DNA-binding subunit
MPMEIKGSRLHYRIRKPIKGAIMRTKDIGTKGHTELLLRKNPKTGKFETQSFTFPVEDIRERRLKTMETLMKLGIKKRALQKVI